MANGANMFYMNEQCFPKLDFFGKIFWYEWSLWRLYVRQRL